MLNKKILILTSLLLLISSISVFADNGNLENNFNEEVQITEDIPEDKSIYSRGWQVNHRESFKFKRYEAWRTGPSGRGPGTLSINEHTTLNREYSASISGSYPVGSSMLAGLVGVKIGKSETHGTSYTVNLKDGQRKQIFFRPQVYVHRFRQDYVEINDVTGEKKILDTKYAEVTEFLNWDYESR